MADQELQQKFFSLLQKQRGFTALDETRKKQLLERFSKASDEQILQAVGTLKLLEDGTSTEPLSPEAQQHLAEAAVQIGHEMKNIDSEQLQMAEVKDKVSSDKDAEKLLEALNKIENPKKKKFLGIF